MPGLLILTAALENTKRLNLALTILRDWEYGDGRSNFYLVSTRNAYELEANPLQPTSIPVADHLTNAWTNASIPDIEAYMLDVTRALDETTPSYIPTTQFIVIDAEGLEGGTAVLLERHYDDGDEDDDDEGALSDRYDKVRLPWDQVHSMFVNLEIANMDFRDFTDWQEGDAEGWHEYVGVGDELSGTEKEKREQEIERLRAEGYVD